MNQSMQDLKSAVEAFDSIPKTPGTANIRLDAMARVVNNARKLIHDSDKFESDFNKIFRVNVKDSPYKRASFLKRARNGMRGFQISWIDADPFSEDANIAGGEIWHENPTQRLICQDMWRKCSQWIVESDFQWVVKMNVIFEGARECPEYIFNYTGSLRYKNSEKLNNAMQAAVNEAMKANDYYKEGHKNKGIYLQCEFVAKIAGV